MGTLLNPLKNWNTKKENNVKSKPTLANLGLAINQIYSQQKHCQSMISCRSTKCCLSELRTRGDVVIKYRIANP
jgi:hypothetical protein